MNAAPSSHIEEFQIGNSFRLVGKCVEKPLELLSRRHPVKDGVPQKCICPHCRRDIAVTMTLPNEAAPRRPTRSAPILEEKRYAYVALLYGGHPAYCIGAVVTGWSLQEHTKIPKQDRILLCTNDVPEIYRDLLSHTWTIRPIEYITKAPPKCYWDYSKSRFKEVFTKLRIFSAFAGEYDKVILMDLDLLIRGDMDELFTLPAPAAMVRGQGYIKHGDPVPIDYFYTGHRQSLGINCGVMLVEPNEKLFRRMEEEVRDYGHPEHWPTHGPEQDYLSRFFNAFSVWTNISCRYNYQVHLTQFGSPEWHQLNTKGHKKVSVFHYSGRLVRPWDILLDLMIAHNMSYDEVIHFVRHSLREKAAETHAYRLRNETHPTLTKRLPVEFKQSKFCNGDKNEVHCSMKCFHHRYIHPSWTEADSEAVVEWIESFKAADESLGNRFTSFLRDLYTQDTNNTSSEINIENNDSDYSSGTDDIVS